MAELLQHCRPATGARHGISSIAAAARQQQQQQRFIVQHGLEVQGHLTKCTHLADVQLLERHPPLVQLAVLWAAQILAGAHEGSGLFFPPTAQPPLLLQYLLQGALLEGGFGVKRGKLCSLRQVQAPGEAPVLQRKLV